MFLFTGATNWAWAASFTDIEFLNIGYYDHKIQFKSIMNGKGCVKIYDMLSSNPHNKVLAFGIHPDVERFPCVIESILDIEYWGISNLVDNIDDFIDFIKYEEYIYHYNRKFYVYDKHIIFIKTPKYE